MLDLSKYEELFSTESREHISILNSALLKLEKEKDLALLGEIFRSLHTLKGMAGSLGYEHIVNLSHRMEDVVEKMRDGELTLSQAAVDLLLKGVDVLDSLIESKGKTKGKKLKDIMGGLDQLVSGGAVSLPSSPVLEEPVLRKPRDVRITLDRLDRLQDLVGDLVITRERLSQMVSQHRLEGLRDNLAAITRLTSGFQDEVSRMRTIPLSQAAERFPRFVRDCARDVGKEVDFGLEGGDIELDRLMLDSLHDPLVHLLRNAVSHGIETSKQRAKAGKENRGKVILKAVRLREAIAISISDDGKGVDVKSVTKAAVKKGLISSKEASGLSNREIFELIASTGLTTSKKVTEVSGRGVGLDVVTETVKNLGGVVEMDSEPGRGTTFTMKLPLTLAVTRVLLVKVGEGVYSLPLAQVMETVKVQPSEFRTVQAREVLILRSEVLPILKLADVLGIGENGFASPPIQVVVCEAEGGRAGLVVDSVLGQMDVVMKPLDDVLAAIEEYAGATVLGDGRPSLILDLPGIIRRIET